MLVDHDYHPDEPDVRSFLVPATGVLRNDDALLTQVRTEDVVLRHFAWTDRWFTLNATYDPAGALIEPRAGDGVFAVNCDLATPFVRRADGVAAVDLFIDVLVRADLSTYRVVDLDEFEEARASGIISAAEARGAIAGLAELTAFIEDGGLRRLLGAADAGLARDAPAAPPMSRTAIDQVPEIRPGVRATWSAEATGTSSGPPST
jgi:protein associated with RNAse G/E